MEIEYFTKPEVIEQSKKIVNVQPKSFSEEQKIAIAKAVLYVISADGIITDEEKSFFVKLCANLKTDDNILKMALELSDDSMLNILKTVSEEQEAYIMTCLNEAAYADNELALEEKTLLDSFSGHLKGENKSKDFYAKILTF